MTQVNPRGPSGLETTLSFSSSCKLRSSILTREPGTLKIVSPSSQRVNTVNNVFVQRRGLGLHSLGNKSHTAN
jgi:hypothetical protein